MLMPMGSEQRPYRVMREAAERAVVIDAGRLGIRRHVVHALVAFDITRARQVLHERAAQTGRSLSLTAFFVRSLATAVGAHPQVCAYRTRGIGGRRLVVFDDVDVVTMIETEVGGTAVPHIIRAANRKSFQQINDEIRGVQSEPGRSAPWKGVATWTGRLPRFLRDLSYWAIRRNPHRFKEYAGTAIVTSVGMFGHGGGWGVGFLPMHTLGVTLGGIEQRPAYVEGEVVPREFISVTISVDHDVVDGAPAARFVDHLRQVVESAACLDGM
jgi:pyruvate/2-oxoglutarate dehydrogenase complex dihydrolipoamide acyltransferase (E2) component